MVVDSGSVRATGSVITLALLLPAAAYAATRGQPVLPSAPVAAPAAVVVPAALPEPVVLPVVPDIKTASPNQRRQWPVSEVAHLDVPAAALTAYTFAETTLAASDPECGLRWSLLAAIGKIESDHGRAGGSEVGTDGVSRPAVRGVALDGAGRVARVPDSDHGKLDGDRTWDRAVGPMQFLPSTWAVVGVDADGDGRRNPDDIHDAALAAAVYLCAYPGSIAAGRGEHDAIYRYNHSESYVEAVRRLERAYASGDYEVISSDPYVTVTLTARPAPDDLVAARPQVQPAAQLSSKLEPTSGPEPGEAPPPAPQPNAPASPEPAPAPTPEPTPEPTPDPSPDPTPEPAPEPEPSPEPTPEPPPTQPLIDVRGVLLTCGEAWCLDDRELELGAQSVLEASAEHDYDEDGLTETVLEELRGLEGREVALAVEENTTPAVVRGINGMAYR